MENAIMEMFVRNQLCINPNYDGEIIVFKGKKYDTTKKAQEYRKISETEAGDGSLELVISFLMENDSIVMSQKSGEPVSLKETFEGFKETLPVKYRAEDFVKRMCPIVYGVAKEFVVKPSEERERGVYSSNIIMNNFSEELVRRAMEIVVGLGDTRFIFTRTRGKLNGNFLDIVEDDLKRFSKIKEPITSKANLVRSMGVPYSDYREFISYGILVSIDLSNNVYVVKNEWIYCMQVKEFSELLDSSDYLTREDRNYIPVYVPEALQPLTKLKWELIR